jgi:hypothetical protein
VADVKNVITLGIGADPGGLLWFMTTGLGEASPATSPAIVMVVPFMSRTMTVPYREHTMTVPYRSRTITVPRKRGMQP